MSDLGAMQPGEIHNPAITRYIRDLFAREDEALQEARRRSEQAGLPAIQVKPEEGRFLEFLTAACGAKKALEIGTLGGYSGIWIARGLGQGGRLISLEVEPLHAETARRHFAAAGLGERVEVWVGDARQTLPALAPEAPFDFIFIDAEKSGYDGYLDWALENVRMGGVIAAHNALRKGSVAGVGEADTYTTMMQTFNRRFADEPHLLSTLYPAGDGMLVGVRIA